MLYQSIKSFDSLWHWGNGWKEIVFCLSVLSLERLFYGLVFHQPRLFKWLCRRDSVRKFLGDEEDWVVARNISHFFKIIQLTVILRDISSKLSLAQTSLGTYFLTGLFLTAVGQILNILVYLRIGSKGVYYGEQLGYLVPWCTKFPFGDWGIKDPQYTGVILTIWGLYLGIGSVDFSWYNIPLIETFLYVMSMQVFENKKGMRGIVRIPTLL